ncbi:hypothetical protein GCM10017559_74100 [Streptosporangium longisporum]|uniref:Uncharacterized protein n=1 Tax=Streptosporangium longisporum TaxID=46187 RepID=A0ABP6LB84_9ACTN
MTARTGRPWLRPRRGRPPGRVRRAPGHHPSLPGLLPLPAIPPDRMALPAARSRLTIPRPPAFPGTPAPGPPGPPAAFPGSLASPGSPRSPAFEPPTAFPAPGPPAASPGPAPCAISAISPIAPSP